MSVWMDEWRDRDNAMQVGNQNRSTAEGIQESFVKKIAFERQV